MNSKYKNILGIVLFLSTLMACNSRLETAKGTLVLDTLSANIQPNSQLKSLFEGDVNPYIVLHKEIFEPLFTYTTAEKASLMKETHRTYGRRDTTPITMERYELNLLGEKDSVTLLLLNYPLKSTLKCSTRKTVLALLFDEAGRLFYRQSFGAIQVVPSFNGKEDLLLALHVDCKGNGYHQIYRLIEKRLVNILNPMGDNRIFTYDTDTTGGVFRRKMLQPEFKDLNEDGVLDIVFSGRKLILVNNRGRRYTTAAPYKALKVSYEMIYNATQEAFLF
jgi:hypothetical protein